MNNPERAISYLVGITHALFMSVQAIAKTHPNPSQLLSELTTAGQLGLAALEPQPVPEATIEGYQFALDGICKAIRSKA